MPASARPRRSSAASIAAPVASPPACRTRRVECAASVPAGQLAVGGRSNSTPQAMSSRSRPRPLGAQHLDRGRVAQPGAGPQGVGDVRLATLSSGERRRRDAALGVPGVALGELGLGDEHDSCRALARVSAAISPAMPVPTTTTRMLIASMTSRWSAGLRREHPLEGDRRVRRPRRRRP